VIHVLLGFDTSWSGEMGVLAFNVGQRQGPVGPLGLAVALLVYALASPLRAHRTVRSLWQGFRMGRRATRSLLVERYEARWAEPIDQVRRDLGLPLAGAA
jgi:ubiquinone biosynthesis protein COQ4